MMRHLISALLTACCLAAPAAACVVPPNAATLAHHLMLHVNQERARYGLRALDMSRQLSAAAQRHACDNARHNRLSHTGTDGSSFGQRILHTGYDYRFAAENVALGYPSPEQVLRAWMQSPGHRRNVLSPRPTDLGLGIALGRDGRPHWVMHAGLR